MNWHHFAAAALGYGIIYGTGVYVVFALGRTVRNAWPRIIEILTERDEGDWGL